MPSEFKITDWITRIIDGPGGMNNYEETEWVVWHTPDRNAAAAWVLRCLANPNCEGSEAVLAAIYERRQEVEARWKPVPPAARSCSCLGTCRGAEGLGAGWACALQKPC